MSNFEAEILKLMDAIPVPGDRHELQIPGECTLAYDASGSLARCFEVAAFSEDVARALRDRKTSISMDGERRLAAEAGYRNPQRMGEHVACLLKRASGQCPVYDAAQRKERTDEEIIEFVRAANA